MSKTVPEMLREAADVFEERSALYGDNYKRFGFLMAALFPLGLTIKSVDDWNRLGVLVQKVSKLTRYAQQWGNGGHADSLIDDSVYTTMLRELDSEIMDESINAPFDLPENQNGRYIKLGGE